MTLALLLVDTPAEVSLTPDVSEVGAILRARTRSDATGAEIGTFNETTRPTGEEAAGYIDQAAIEVALRLPTDELPERLSAFARHLIALRAAMMVELSYDPDRTGDQSAYQRLQEQYTSGMTALNGALEDAGLTIATTGRLVVATIASPYSGDDTAALDPVTDLVP